MKIAVIHATMNAVSPLMKEFEKADASVQVINYVNENLLLTVNEEKNVTRKALRMFANLVFAAAETDVAGILVACSVYCKYVPLLEPFLSIPVVAIDRPMLEKAVSDGEKIGIVATTAMAAPTAKIQMEKLAKEQGKTIRTEEKIVTEAMKELKKGNVQRHNQLIKEACVNLEKKGCDTILLCQITMASAVGEMKECKAEVLTSPTEGVRKILQLCKK